MYFWTIQEKNVIENILKYSVYYPMVDYKTGAIYDLNEKAKELKNKINLD